MKREFLVFSIKHFTFGRKSGIIENRRAIVFFLIEKKRGLYGEKGGCMVDRVEEKRELGFTDVVRLLFKKWKILVVCVVTSAILAGGFSFVFRKIDVSYGAAVKYGISVYSHRDSDAALEEKKESHTFESKHLAEIVDELSSGDFTAKIIKKLHEIENSARKDKSFGYVVVDRDDPAFDAKAYGDVNRKMQSYVTYSFDYAKNPNAISVLVSVPKDKVLAEEILSIIKSDVPQYIEENITVPVSERITEVENGSQVTDWLRFTAECRELSYSYCEKLDSHKDVKTAVSWAVIGGIFGVLIGAAIALFSYKGKDEPTKEKTKVNAEKIGENEELKQTEENNA